MRRRERMQVRNSAERTRRLRVVGPMPQDPAPAEPTVRLQLGEIFPLLLHAYRQNHTWLADMADDPIAVTPDLAQLLATFRELLESHKPA